MILAQLTHQATLGMFLFQESGQTVGFSPMDLWHNMGIPAKMVVGVLFIMSIWSLAVIIDRASTSAQRVSSRVSLHPALPALSRKASWTKQ